MALATLSLASLASLALVLGATVAEATRRRRASMPAPPTSSSVPSDVAELEHKPALDAASEKPEGAAEGAGKVETIRLLITGYGPFRGYPTENPSTLTARHLDKLVLPAPPSRPAGRPRQIAITFLPVAVSYAAIDAVVPPFHAEGAYDAYVHVGVASGAKGGLRLERRARRAPYDMADSDGRLCAHGPDGRRAVPGWAGKDGEKKEWRSSLDLDALLGHLREKGVEHVRLSDDAGLYLCEYIYATSLNAAHSAVRPTPVLFVHVPDLRPEDVPAAPDQPVYTEREVAEVLKLVCGWVGARA